LRLVEVLRIALYRISPHSASDLAFTFFRESDQLWLKQRRELGMGSLSTLSLLKERLAGQWR